LETTKATESGNFMKKGTPIMLLTGNAHKIATFSALRNKLKAASKKEKCKGAFVVYTSSLRE
jgi:predicted secreted Zn-dependent protease